jgi:hypothetical protein
MLNKKLKFILTPDNWFAQNPAKTGNLEDVPEAD